MAVISDTLGELLLKRYTKDMLVGMQQMPLWGHLMRAPEAQCPRHRRSTRGCKKCRNTGLHPMPMSELYADTSLE